MTVNPVSDIFTYGGYIRTSANVAEIRRAADVISMAEKSILDKNTSQEQKNTLVTESSDAKSSAAIYDYRFVPGAPLSRSQESDKAFNETKKTVRKDPEQKNFKALLDEEEPEEERPAPEVTGKGYYIVLNDPAPAPEKKTTFTPVELWQERINSTYHVSRSRRNGTLVNLTF